MTAAHLQNFHSPENHNRRVIKLVQRKNRLLAAAKAEHLWLVDLEKDGIKLNREDSDRCSRLFFEIRELAADVLELESLILPTE